MNCFIHCFIYLQCTKLQKTKSSNKSYKASLIDCCISEHICIFLLSTKFFVKNFIRQTSPLNIDSHVYSFEGKARNIHLKLHPVTDAKMLFTVSKSFDNDRDFYP